MADLEEKDDIFDEDIKEEVFEDKTDDKENEDDLPPINPKAAKRREFVKKHKVLISCSAICCFSMLIGALLFNSGLKKVRMAENELNAQRDSITQLQEASKKVKQVVRDLPVDLNEARHKQDDNFMCSWIYDAYQWSGIEEYNTNREAYVELLGEDDLFIKDCFPEMNVTGTVLKDGVYIGDAEDLVKSNVKKFDSYIISIDGDTYTYLGKIYAVQDFYNSERKSIMPTDVYALFIYTLSDPKGVSYDLSETNDTPESIVIKDYVRNIDSFKAAETIKRVETK